MRLLRYRDLPITPWKNGGGITREIVSTLDDGGGADFLWRVSIATISASGPFSLFDNVDRTIAVLSGNGIRLSHPAGTTELTTSAPPYAFVGETPIFAHVIEGETTDLNAMSLRHSFHHEMQRHLVSKETILRTTAHQSVIVFGGPMTVHYYGEAHAVAALDAVTGIAQDSILTLNVSEPTPCYLIMFRPLK
ncbi:HutD/Ves family protein [Devosia submarina]|uniref:HutD/Ves family protein n=1 Tax=Devosia submarina TaxID=1173082 RepID=UPI00130046F2|nr:HutD family protein [Devosia submarina]